MVVLFWLLKSYFLEERKYWSEDYWYNYPQRCRCDSYIQDTSGNSIWEAAVTKSGENYVFLIYPAYIIIRRSSNYSAEHSLHHTVTIFQILDATH